MRQLPYTSISYENIIIKIIGNFLVVQWLELQTLTAEGPGSISGQGIKIWQAAKKEKKNIIM